MPAEPFTDHEVGVLRRMIRDYERGELRDALLLGGLGIALKVLGIVSAVTLIVAGILQIRHGM